MFLVLSTINPVPKGIVPDEKAPCKNAAKDSLAVLVCGRVSRLARRHLAQPRSAKPFLWDFSICDPFWLFFCAERAEKKTKLSKSYLELEECTGFCFTMSPQLRNCLLCPHGAQEK
jgi:hypothetical protein